MRKTWLVAGAAVGVMSLATMGGVALAQTATPTATPTATAAATATPTPKPKPPSYESRLAAKLGITEDKLSAAIKSVRRDEQDDMVKALLDRAVKAGKVTQADADADLAWWKARPDTMPLMPLGRFERMKGLEKMKGFAPRGPKTDGATPPATPTTQQRRDTQDIAVKAMLDIAVKNGKMTQADADKLLAWWKSRPDSAITLLGAIGGPGHEGAGPKDNPRGKGGEQKSDGQFGQSGGQGGNGPSPRGKNVTAPWMQEGRES